MHEVEILKVGQATEVTAVLLIGKGKIKTVLSVLPLKQFGQPNSGG